VKPSRGPRLNDGYTRAAGWERLELGYKRARPRAKAAPASHSELASVLAPHQGLKREPSLEARAIVSRLAGFGLSVTQISRLTGYRPSTLYRSFRHELSVASLQADVAVLESAYWQAVGGPEKDWRRAEPSMTRLWLGQRLGWKPPSVYGPSKSVQIDLDRLSDDELNELDRILERASDAGRGEGGA
jgi:hypothetical protein